MSTKNISLENEVSNIKEKDVEKQENKNETTKLEENEVKTQNEVIKDENNSNTSNKTINDTKYVPNNYVPAENNSKNDVMSNFTIFVILFIIVLLILFAGFTLYNMFNTNIINGVSIKGLDVSNLSKSDAKYQLDNYIANSLPQEIKLKHNEYETTISLSQIGVSFDTKKASNYAYDIGRKGNIFENNLTVLSTLFGHINIEPTLNLDEEQLKKNLEDISLELPDGVLQSSYYIEGNNLIITSGKEGNVVDVEKTIEAIKNSISTFSCKDSPVELVVRTEAPDSIDLEKIYNEIYKEPVDAYYTQNPFTVYPSENGLDFNISMDEAKNIIFSEQKDEYTIPLKTLTPNVTTNMIGTEAFPDLLSSYSTNYSTRDKDRTTNLILAANKINGTVVMPGETFSYNKVVGARTIAARI